MKFPTREASPKAALKAGFLGMVSVCFGIHLIPGKTGTYWLILAV
jgi:hypothetical protein